MGETNYFIARGTVVTDPAFSHVGFDGDEFLMFFMFCERKSGTKDKFKCVAKKRIAKGLESGDRVEIYGQIRTRNVDVDGKKHLDIYVYVSETYKNEPVIGEEDKVYLDGFICKPPVYRRAPLGREIADVLLAVNRPYGKSDYIPCIFWGRSARAISKKNVGDNILVRGRLQSREYGKETIKTAYEVSADNYWLDKNDCHDWCGGLDEHIAEKEGSDEHKN